MFAYSAEASTQRNFRHIDVCTFSVFSRHRSSCSHKREFSSSSFQLPAMKQLPVRQCQSILIYKSLSEADLL